VWLIIRTAAELACRCGRLSSNVGQRVGRSSVNEDLPDLQSLVGEQLNAVTFVMDYVQFHFNGPVLTAHNHPIAEFHGVRTQFPSPGSRDALCSLIEQEVGSVEDREHVHIRVAFRSGHVLIVPLDDGSYIGPEAATFSDPTKKSLVVW
jgi:hypothetical protein